MPHLDPRRGEVWVVDTGYVGKTRPCLVISVPFDDQDRAPVTYVPRTTSVRGSRFEVDIEVPFLQQPGVFDAQGIGTIANAKFQRKLGELSAAQFAKVEMAVKQWLGFIA